MPTRYSIKSFLLEQKKTFFQPSQIKEVYENFCRLNKQGWRIIEIEYFFIFNIFLWKISISIKFDEKIRFENSVQLFKSQRNSKVSMTIMYYTIHCCQSAIVRYYRNKI